MGRMVSIMINFVGKYQTVFQSGCAFLHFYQQFMRVPLVSHPCQWLTFFNFIFKFKILTILMMRNGIAVCL